MIQTVCMGILQCFGDLPHQTKARVNIQRLALVTQEPVETCSVGVVLKDEGWTALVLVQIERFENPGVVHALQQAKLPLCRLASGVAAEFGRLQGLWIDPHPACNPGEPHMRSGPVLIRCSFPKQPL